MSRLHEVDLNLLVLFRHMYTERHTGRVAEIMGLTQPSVSHALKRLRVMLDDELFEKASRGMRPTPYAEAIAGDVDDVLSALEKTLSYRNTFTPWESQREFRVAMTDLGEIYLLPRLMNLLSKEAPGVRITTVRDTAVPLKIEMENGGVDLAIGLLPQLEAGFYQRRLFDQRYVCLMRKDHPLSAVPFDEAAFRAAQHIKVMAQDSGHKRIFELFAKAGISDQSLLCVPHFMAIPYILSETDFIVTVTEKLALQTAQRFGLAIRPLPYALPGIQINLFWHSHVHQDAANIWLRRCFMRLFTE
ncbi:MULTISPECIES: LysR family transcriptional regulator [Enterobacteriaceae]|uniref:LysR family transcriptional regulator n=1 Tax=Kluyvera genomosp. 2 TaxID=2774054 RepID=A0A2T2Y2M1_9ENTR|nr:MULTISPECIES: LysR family transcriptional regulator [Enterobacteriaceae]HAT3918473.1 LysR family transcriptional regulator [Kluyvera ascorbata]PSR46779.1 LysR family transcriptional regulator [Kluyvera genomosp. 2]BBQ83864.1 LysR family transcriptional regulator [Klebsiella sp. WP3-W18-ESBL-02]BBR20825.1 LysR family transcriptional regulator [Klebsiella sp. WP3-S18-ESBL-05]BBR58962.1 LysR family transcriptional regulator [Klebsiella sp. WP4-W18-ESBL-05]